MSDGARLHHLDFLRGSMMSLGVLVHASHADYDLGPYGWVRSLSGAFRMECFFVLAGYFSLMSLERHGPRRFLARRAVALGVPALVGIVLLNPPAVAWMSTYFATAPAPATLRINWHGPYWFLLVLLLYATATDRLARALAPARAWLGRAPGLAAAAIAAGAAAVAVVAVKLLDAVAPGLPGLEAWGWITRSALLHLPFFIFGVLMRSAPPLFALVHARPWAWVALAAGAALLKAVVQQRPVTSLGEHLIGLGAGYLCGFACSVALIAVAGRLLPTGSRVVSFLADSAYTLYVVHYLIVALVLLAAQRLGLPMPARAVAAAALAFAAGLSLHAGVVRRVPLAALLLNGRVDRPRPDAPAAAP